LRRSSDSIRRHRLESRWRCRRWFEREDDEVLRNGKENEFIANMIVSFVSLWLRLRVQRTHPVSGAQTIGRAWRLTEEN
jgi:hypothetical protein